MNKDYILHKKYNYASGAVAISQYDIIWDINPQEVSQLHHRYIARSEMSITTPSVVIRSLLCIAHE